MKRRILVVAVLIALLAGLVGGSQGTARAATPDRAHVSLVHSHAAPAAFDKTKFLIHLGIAAFMIHYIYGKYKAGKLSHFHLFTDIKAAAAALIAVHELKVAYDDAKNSNSATLHALIAPIQALIGAFNDMASKLKHGDTSAISNVNSQESSFASLAGKDGFGFKDVSPSGGAGF